MKKLAVGTKKPKITMEKSSVLGILHQVSKLKVTEITKNKKLFPTYPKCSTATSNIHALKPLDGSREVDGRHNKKGRPKLCTP